MLKDLMKPKEKKVEYVELIYDLIFVYVIGRNNSLLHSFENGFVAPSAFLAYVMTTLAVIQIWNYTTYYVNIYGRHGVRDHVFLFINMFLMYFVGAGTRADWQGFHAQYHAAWALILVNIGAQYLIELKNHRGDGMARGRLLRMAFILFSEAAIVTADIFCYKAFGSSWLSLAAIVFGMASVMLFGQRGRSDAVDFTHLTERAMLYVVFTFGEMIIAVASYFGGEFSLRSTYFALMAFLIVTGLFLSYGVFYDRIIDREKRTSGLLYMLLHIIIVFAMNNITNGLEFMREEEISLLPKVGFLAGSFLLFFGFLFGLGFRHAKTRCRLYTRLCLRALGAGLAFAAGLLLLRKNMVLNIALSAAFVFAMFIMIWLYGKKVDEAK